MFNNNLLGKHIREERKKLGYTQEQLAELINISSAYLGQIERGERSITLDKLVPLSKQLNVSIDYLVSEHDPSTDYQINQFFSTLQSMNTKEIEMYHEIVRVLHKHLK